MFYNGIFMNTLNGYTEWMEYVLTQIRRTWCRPIWRSFIW